MGMVEVAAEFESVADCLVASAESVPGNGYPYDYWMANFANTAGSVEALYSILIDNYAYTYRNYTRSRSGGVRSYKVGALMTALNDYSQDMTNVYDFGNWTITNGINPSESLYNSIIASGMLYAYSSGIRYEIDPYRLAETIVLDSSDALKTAVDDLVLDEWHQYDTTTYSDNNYAHGIALFFGDPMLMQYDLEYYISTNLNQSLFRSDSRWIDIEEAFFEFPPYAIMRPDSNYSGSLVSKESRFYQFRVDTAGSLTIDLTPGAGCDDDMYFINNGIIVESSLNSGADVPEQIVYTSTDAGWYFVWVKRYSGTTSPQYALTVTEGTADIY